MFGPKSPAYSIGTSKRKFNLNKAVPGPASYNIQRDPLVRSVSFNKARKHSKSICDIPGPGSYVVNSSIGHTPHAIIISRKASKSDVLLPGPGSYNINVDFNSQPKWTISKAKKGHTLSEIVPSSADYTPRSSLKRVPAYSIGNSVRSDLYSAKSNPGPGAYEVQTDSSAPKFSIVNKHEAFPKEIVPGPGEYNNNLITYKPKSPSTVFGRSKKKTSFIASEGPGPGQYGINRNLKGPKFSFTREKRDASKIKAMPGPGQYEIPSTIGSARSSQSLNNTFS